MAETGGYQDTAPGLQAEIGRRVAKLRLARNVTQQTLAREAGVGLRTLRRLEGGQSTSLDTFLRVVIALGCGDDLVAALPAYDIRPIERADGRGAERRRARPRSQDSRTAPWTWGDESRD